MAKRTYYIDEQTASKMLGYKPYSMRRFCRGSEKKLPIRTAKLNYRTVVYALKDIEDFIESKFQY